MKTALANLGPWRPTKGWSTGLLVWLLWLGAVTAGQGAYPRWTGAVNGYWSEPNNWDPAVVPANGDGIFFSKPDAQHHTTTNDLVNLSLRGLNFGKFEFEDEENHHNYQVYGNSLRLTGGLTDDGRLRSHPDGDNEVTIHCPLVFQDGGEVDVFPHFGLIFGSTASLRLNGPITVEDGLLTLSASGPASPGVANNVGHIFSHGAISGSGSVRAETYEEGFVHFIGPLNNTFTGGLFLDTPEGGRVIFEKTAGFVVTNLLEVSQGATGRVEVVNPNQVGPATVLRVTSRSRFELTGGTLNIGSLVISNQTFGSFVPVVDTGSATLGLLGSISTSVRTNSQAPIIRGLLNLTAGDHLFNVSAPQYEGLNIEAQIIGPGGFTKTGNAALLLQGNNSFLGSVKVNAGVLDVRHAQALGGTGGGTEIFEGNLTLRNVVIGAEPLLASGGAEGEFPGSALTSIGLSSWAGTVVLNTNLVVNGDMTFTGPISGSGGVGCFGGGTIRLGGAQANTYTGTTLVRCPLVEFTKPHAVNAFSGPLIVGNLSGGPSEARWTNSYQSAGTLLTLYANGLVNLNNTTERFGSITFHGGQIDSGQFGICVLGNPVLTNASYLTVHAASTPAIINGFLQPAGGAAWITVSNGVADPDLVINAGVVGNAPQLIKQGAGTMRLAGAGNYTGVTIVNEGTLEVAHNAALGSASFGTIVNEAATLRLNTFNPVPEGFALFGTGFDGTNGVLHATGNTTLTGGIFLNGPSTIHVAPGALLAVDNIICGAGPLTKTGTGNFYLGGVSGGTGHNTYSGDTVVSAGLLYLSKNQGVRAVPGNLIIGNGATGPATARFNRSGMMNASAIITVNANGLLDLNGNNQTLPRLNLNDGGDVQTGAGTLSFTAGGVVSVGTLNAPQVGLRSGASISGKIALPILDYLTFEVAPYGAAPFPGEGPELNVSAVIRDAGNITKTGAGALRLGGANTFNDAPPNFSGDVVVNGGTLIAAHATALGGTAGWTFVNNSASLALLEGITITGENLYLNSDHPRALDNIAGDNTWTGPISLTRDTTVASSLDWSLTTSGVIGGAGRLTKVGAGVLWLSGTANNSHAGDTLVDEGWLGLAKSAFVRAVPQNLIIGRPAGGAFAAALHVSTDQIWGQVTVNPGGGLNLNGYQEYIGNLTLNGGGDVFTGNGTLHLTTVAVNPGAFANQSLISGRLGLNASSVPINVGTGTMAGGAAHCLITTSIVQSAGTSVLHKTGGGTLQLTGTNTYTGVTYVGSGALQVDGVQPQSAVELDHDTRLQGAGTVGHILFNGTTAIAPGASAGTLTCSNFDASGGAGNLEVELNGHPTGYDQIVARGLVDLRGLALQASLNFLSTTGQQFTLIHNDGADAVTGTFTGLPQNAALSINSESFQISYTGGTGNDVVLTRMLTPPRPKLEMERIPPASVRLKWPTNFTGYTLQFSTNLSATNWSTATPPPVITGTNRVVTNATANSPKFYRLLQ